MFFSDFSIYKMSDKSKKVEKYEESEYRKKIKQMNAKERIR